MPGFNKQKFIILVPVLLSFGRSIATNCASLNNQSCMVRPMLTDCIGLKIFNILKGINESKTLVKHTSY